MDGWMDGWMDGLGLGLDLRVGGGIKHLTVLIIPMDVGALHKCSECQCLCGLGDFCSEDSASCDCECHICDGMYAVNLAQLIKGYPQNHLLTVIELSESSKQIREITNVVMKSTTPSFLYRACLKVTGIHTLQLHVELMSWGYP